MRDFRTGGVRSSRGPRVRGVLLIVPLVVLFLSVGAAPSFAQLDIGDSRGPLTHIYVGETMSCQVVFNDVEKEFFGTSPDGSCATQLGDLGLEASSQTAVTGNGDPGTPRTVVTVATTPDGVFELTRTDTYLAGSASYHSKVDVKNNGDTPTSTLLWHGADCTAQGSDYGYGFFDSASGGIYCSPTNTVAAAGRMIGFVPASSGSRYFEGQYGTARTYPGPGGFPNTCTGDLVDNGIGLSWPIDSLAVGDTATRELDTTITPAGTLCAASPVTVPPSTSIASGPTGSTTQHDATFTFGSSDPSASFECSLDGAPFTPCASPTTYSGLATGDHTFQVRARDGVGNLSAASSRTWTVAKKELDDLPKPVLGKEANVEPVSGTVLVGIKGGAAAAGRGVRASQKGITFVPLAEARQIPVGSFLDTRKGTVALQSSSGSKKKKAYLGNFGSGLFQVLQSRKKSAKGLTDLVMKGGKSSSSCKTKKKKKGKRATAALSKKALRRLRGSAKGRFRTKGRYGAATVRGTKWTVTDRCDGTLTKVTRGKVSVRDYRRKKTVLVKTGKSYLAKAPH